LRWSKIPKVQDRTIFKHVRGPDFPTGGILVDDPSTIQEAYRTGRGSFRVRARWQREEGARGTYQIVVDQIPYQVQKAKADRAHRAVDRGKEAAAARRRAR
jgi:topoisomerase-4 subunit A